MFTARGSCENAFFFEILQIFSKISMKFEKKMSTALEMNAIFEKSMSKNVGVGARPRKCFE